MRKKILKSGLKWEKYQIGDRIYRQDEMPNQFIYR